MTVDLEIRTIFDTFRILSIADEVYSRYGGNGYNVFSGAWMDAAREDAKERAEELEGDWKGNCRGT